MCACVVCACGVWKLMKQRLFAVFQPYWLEGFLANVFVFWFVLFVWHAVGCLGQHKYCCSIDHPLMKQDLLLVVAYVFLGCIWCGCCVWGGVLCENCIVDANAIKKQQ